MLGLDLCQELRKDYVVEGADITASARQGVKFYQSDITDRNNIAGIIADARPNIVIHTAAWTDVDGCEREKDKGVKKVITECPHCFNTLKNDYRQYGIELEVIHHTELINDLIKSGKLRLDGSKDLGNVVFHDSCYLGRYSNIYEAPRQVITSVTHRVPTEIEHNLDKSFCCGAGGGRMWMEESTGNRINVTRVEQALEKDPNTICVCCPYCLTMFEDGLKDKKAEEKVQVLDLAEMVAGALKKQNP